MRTASIRLLLLVFAILASASPGLRAQTGLVIDDRPATVKPDRACPANIFRFRSCNNGTTVDQVTGLVWLRSAGCVQFPGAGGSNLADWSTAMAGATALADGSCGLTDGSQPGDWRLPTRAEWEVLLRYARDDLACGGSGDPVFTNNEGTSCYDPSFPFNSILSLKTDSYWSSTVDGEETSKVKIADLATGLVDTGRPKAATARLWAVRDPR